MMFLLRITVLFLFAIASAYKAQSNELTTKLDKQLSVNSERYKLVGQSVLIQQDGKTIYRGVHGLANIELGVNVQVFHKFPSYSVAKLFTSVVVMNMVEQGRIDPKKSIGIYLPHLPKPWHKITVEHLLTHSSGVPRYFDSVLASNQFPGSKSAVYAKLNDAPEHFEMGSENRYNNTNFLLLASIVETVSGEKLSKHVDDLIIGPLKLNNTGFASARTVVPNLVSSYQNNDGDIISNLVLDWPEYTYSHSALYSTPEDLATFITALFNGHIINQEALYRFMRPTRLSSGKPGRYAFGFEFATEDTFNHVGHDGGNRVKLRYYYNESQPNINYSLVYMTNGGGSDVWTDVLADSVMSIVSPTNFKTASFKEAYITAILEGDESQLNAITNKLTSDLALSDEALESFLLYRAYAIRYGVGIETSLSAFAFLAKTLPNSERAKRALRSLTSKLN